MNIPSLYAVSVYIGFINVRWLCVDMSTYDKLLSFLRNVQQNHSRISEVFLRFHLTVENESIDFHVQTIKIYVVVYEIAISPLEHLAFKLFKLQFILYRTTTVEVKRIPNNFVRSVKDFHFFFFAWTQIHWASSQAFVNRFRFVITYLYFTLYLSNIKFQIIPTVPYVNSFIMYRNLCHLIFWFIFQ